MANKFETEIKTAFTKLPPQLEHPKVLAGLPFLYHKLVVNKQSSYGVDSPCDAIVDSIPPLPNLALELKEFATRSSFPFIRLEEHQENGLLKFEALGRKAYLLVCFRKWQLSAKEKLLLSPAQIKKEEEKRAYAININDYLKLKEKSIGLDRKSIDINDIIVYARRLPITRSSTGELIWDIHSLLV